MTKKENDLFRKIYKSIARPRYFLNGVFDRNCHYYTANPFMAIRAFDQPDLPMIPEEDREADTEAAVENYFDEAILHGIGEINLPTKREIVDFRKHFTAEKMREHAYILTVKDNPNMNIGVNINYLNMFLDVFGGRDCHCYTCGPVRQLYFVNERKNIEAILMPIKVRNYFNCLNPEVLC